MLKIKNLTKVYGTFKAVDNLTLDIEEGEIFGFVGPNGAGKTTTMKMVSTLLNSTEGEIYIDGLDISKNIKQAREKIGYMPDFFGVYDNLKVDEYLEFYGNVAGLSREQIVAVSDDLLELVDLKAKKSSYVDSLSRGMKQRLCLARSLIHNPKLLVLDEPASGMDPRARVQMKEILKELKKMGKTILISSHILPELAEICTTIGIIENGKIVIKGPVEEIVNKISSGNNTIKIKLVESNPNTIRLLEEDPLVGNIYENGRILEIEFNGDEEDTFKLIKKLVNKEIPIVSFNHIERNLEEIFMKVTKGGEE
ncbi:ABC transporter ATP-binding protein [Tissierella creatinophila]|uniref:Putative ABC transporter ATP-binding protein YxlF n=1 Tax=Tissierella creatinophila DSM 6911 TaxID=1123403 RepID=A0A1U7M7U3_TISCR|nr:ABC transporter ATP-binding protein [Tissierella creatinophila]OLS03268.1 putative ABC transporter ATP-binding protein YxlF [Tissierella creatinophila DSM 6911]